MKNENNQIELLKSLCCIRKGVEWSREKFNHVCDSAARLAIGSGFVFDDELILLKIGSGYGATSIFYSERCYSLAVAEGNTSFCIAYEKMVGREPIIADCVDPSKIEFGHMAGQRVKERLHVGCRFRWQGKMVTVTSFNSSGAAIACEYGNDEKTRYKVKKRHTITRAKVIDDRAKRKGFTVDQLNKVA